MLGRVGGVVGGALGGPSGAAIGSNIGTELAFNSYEKVAEGYGGKGYYVEDHESLFETLKQAKEDAKLGFPVLVNVKLAKSEFRKGSISV